MTNGPERLYNAIWWATQHHTAYKAPTTHVTAAGGDG